MSHPTRDSVRRLADDILAGRLDAKTAAEESWQRADADATCELLLAAAVAGQPPDARQVGPLLHEISDIDLMPILVGACAGARCEMLLEAVTRGRMSSERDALALFLAVELRGDPPPPGLPGALRTHVRRFLGLEASIVTALAVKALGDPAVLKVAESCLPMAQVVEAPALRDRILRLLRTPPLESLPERPRAHVVSGFTVRRPAPKVGRNDPCPCGSGKKYKRCCEQKDAQRAADPSPVAGLTRAEYLREAGAQIGADELQRMRPAELAAIDLETLATTSLIAAMRRASEFRRWDLAEAAMGVLASRTDAPEEGNGDGHRADLIAEAVEAGAHDVAERQLDLLQDKSIACPADVLALELRRPSDRTLARLEEEAAAGLCAGEEGRLIDLAYALLGVSPALGILVARASLSVGRALDSEMLLEVLEEARDRLGLPPGDSVRDTYDLLLDHDAARQIQEVGRRRETAEQERLAEEAESLRDRLEESRARIADLERGLRAQNLASASPAPAPTVPPKHVAKALPPSPPTDEEARRWRSKVADLKQLLQERSEERTQLRKQLAKVNDALASASRTDDRVGDPEDEEDGSGDVEVPRSLLLPVYSPTARAAMERLPEAVSCKAIKVLTLLATGEGAAWRQVKRMVAVDRALLSCRLGIHHRALFRVEGGELAVADVIHRKDLDAAVRRHGRGQ